MAIDIRPVGLIFSEFDRFGFIGIGDGRIGFENDLGDFYLSQKCCFCDSWFRVVLGIRMYSSTLHVEEARGAPEIEREVQWMDVLSGSSTYMSKKRVALLKLSRRFGGRMYSLAHRR